MLNKPLISFDYGIKYLLNDPNNYSIIEHFLSCLLETRNYGPIRINAILKTETNRESRNLKKPIVDFIVEDQHNIKYIIELERAYSSNFTHNICFNSSRLITETISWDENYSNIQKLFHISLLYFSDNIIESNISYSQAHASEINHKHSFELHITDKHGKMFDPGIILPEYFVISVPLFDDIIRNEIDEYLYVIKHCDAKDDFMSSNIQQLVERLSILRMSEDEKNDYYKYVQDALTKRDIIIASEARIMEAIATGRTSGELSKAEEIAKAMLSAKEKIDIISKYTKLSRLEIEKLQ